MQRGSNKIEEDTPSSLLFMGPRRREGKKLHKLLRLEAQLGGGDILIQILQKICWSIPNR